MGYYSQTAIECGEKAAEKLNAVLAENNFPPDKIYRLPFEKTTVFYWDRVKWYEGYDEIEAVMDCLSDLDDAEDKTDDIEYYHHLIRIGEEESDIEHRWGMNCQYSGIGVESAIWLPEGAVEIYNRKGVE